jgi:N-acyl-D-aspartate/D-glutamate deacylase
MYDIVIRNGKVVDGTGNPWFYADMAVNEGRIVEISKNLTGEVVNVIDAEGLVVCPGFIDAHSHGDYNTLVYRDMENVVHQGITTVMAGQCGSSPAPLSDEIRGEVQKEIDARLPEGVELKLTWDTFDEYLREEEKEGLGANVAHLVGHRGAADEFTALYELLLEEEGAASMVIFYGDEDDVKRIMRHPLQMVGTDSGCCNVEGPFKSGKPHPRHYGTYPRILGRYVREEKTLRLEEAVRKMTSFPAQRFGLSNRGVVRPGMWADITVFNTETVIDTATYDDPHQFPAGIDYVLVNGEVTIKKGRYTGAHAGRTLRKR